MAITRLNAFLNLAHPLLRRRPGEVIATDLNVIIRKLAQLIVIHAQQLRRLISAQFQAGHEVDGVGEDGGHEEGVGAAGEDVGDLDVELAVVVDEPAAGHDAGVDAVEADDGGGCEEGVEDEADDAGDAVFGEDVHGVVDLDPEFDWGVLLASDKKERKGEE